MGGGIDAGHEAVEHGPGGARRQGRVAVAGGALGGDGVVVEEHGGVLGHQTGHPDDLAGGEAVGLGPADPDLTARRCPQADEVGQQRRLARAVAAHEGDDLAGVHLEVDALQRRNRPVPGVEVPGRRQRPGPFGPFDEFGRFSWRVRVACDATPPPGPRGVRSARVARRGPAARRASRTESGSG